jgi:predicted PurR-regulated permease PerM/phosphoglycolate phosphatase-like HAD superfamily hydrolase
MRSSRWSNTTKIIVVAILILLLIAVLIAFRAMIAPTVVGCLLAFVLSHPVNWLQRRTGWGRSLAIVLVFLATLLLLMVMPVIFVPRLIEAVLSLQNILTDLAATMQSTTAPSLLQWGGFQFDPATLLQQANNALEEGISALAAGLLTLALDVTTGIMVSIYALVLSFWLLRDGHKMQRMILESIPVEYKADAVHLGQDLAQTWTGFIQGQLTVALVVGLMIWVIMGAIGMPNVGGLALLAAVMEFLPGVGFAISSWIAIAVALFQGSTWMPIPDLPFAILVAVLYFILAQLENLYLVPRFVGSRVKLEALVALISVIIGTIVFGALGVLLAMPVVASARILFAYVYSKLLDQEPFEPLHWDDPGVRVPGLVAGRRIEGVIFDLDGTLAQVDWRMAEQIAHFFDWAERVVPYERRVALARQLMRIAESPINRWISLLIWLRLSNLLARIRPSFDRWRGLAPAQSMQPVDGSLRLLTFLAPHYHLGLITTRSRAEVECFFARYGLLVDTVASLVSQENISHLPPHGEALTLSVAQLRQPPDSLLMVADTEVQLRPARLLGVATVGVVSGLSDAAHLADADLILDSAVQLEERL